MTTPYVDPQSVHNPSTGTAPPASWGDTVRADLEFLARRPGCVIRRTTTQSIPNTTLTAIEFNASDLRDTDAYHDTATNSSRITIPTGLGGIYSLGVSFAWATTATANTVRTVRARVNGSTVIATDDRGGVSNATYATSSGLQIVYPLVAGDYVEFLAFHSVGSAHNILNTLPCVAWALLETVT